MKLSDAFNILGLSGETTPELTKAAYRKACAKYHPDRNPAGLEMMQMVNQAYDAVRDYTGGTETTTETINYGDDIANALNAIMGYDLHIEVCGSWVWVSGDTRPAKEILKENDFKWAPKKCMWFYRPEGERSYSRGTKSIDDIRMVYGSQRVQPQQRQKLSA
jgi:hypothetical protein